MSGPLFIFNISLGLSGLLICIFGILQILFGVRIDRRTEHYFLLFFTFLALFDLSNLVGQILRGHAGSGFRTLLYLTNFGEFLFPCLCVYVVSIYLLSIIDPGHNRKFVRRLILGLVIVHVLILLYSQFNSLIYVIDENNIYHRSNQYPVVYVMTMLIMTIDIYLLITERSKLTRNEQIAFWIYFIIPSFAVIAQVRIYGIYLLVFSTIITAFVMYLFILREKTELYYRRERELDQLKSDILISQVQPHFIFNSLTAIRSLCNMDSEAYKAIEHFAGFLRGSLDILNEKNCIPFLKELNTVENYLYMEKLRFEDKLKVVSDMRDTSFVLPACSLQILVENAVKHGIRMNRDGTGTMMMRSYKDIQNHYHIIEVHDDGVGFDTEAVPAGTGLSNLRRRLEIMCNGQLEINSVPTKGTLARIKIPFAERGEKMK